MKAKRWLVCFFGVCLCWFLLRGVVGCDNGPSGVIPQEEFELIMADLMEQNGYYRGDLTLQERFQIDSIELYAPYFARKGIKREEFDRSLHHYLSNEKEFDAMMDQVVSILNQRLELLRDSMERAKSNAPIPSDSGRLKLKLYLDSLKGRSE